MSTEGNCFFCNNKCSVIEIPSLSFSKRYLCEYCGDYLLDPQDSTRLSGQTDNRFKIACVLNERRLKKLGGIALNNKTDMKDKVFGLPRISVDDTSIGVPRTISTSRKVSISDVVYPSRSRNFTEMECIRSL